MELSLENLNIIKYLSDAISMSEGILEGRWQVDFYIELILYTYLEYLWHLPWNY